MKETTSTHGVVVVGVDGSTNSIEAVRVALREAAWRGATVRAVTAWEYPSMYGIDGAGMGVTGSELEDGASAALDGALAEAVPDESARAAIERVVSFGPASSVLVEASKGADVMVVGARGHGGFLGLLLGSVSNQVVHHAHCPVLVVPGDRGSS